MEIHNNLHISDANNTCNKLADAPVPLLPYFLQNVEFMAIWKPYTFDCRYISC